VEDGLQPVLARRAPADRGRTQGANGAWWGQIEPDDHAIGRFERFGSGRPVTRYDKTVTSYRAVIDLATLALWL